MYLFAWVFIDRILESMCTLTIVCLQVRMGRTAIMEKMEPMAKMEKIPMTSK